MKRSIAVVYLAFLAFASFDVSAQRQTPAGAGDKNLADRGIKERSIDLERTKRDAAKPDREKEAPPPADAAKFEQIKEDFENIQRLQDEILKTYTTGKQIEAKKIAANAEEIKKRAIRLEANLFPIYENTKNAKKSKEAQEIEIGLPPLPQGLKSLIVEQDNTLARFISNPMFAKPAIANVNDQATARSDLQKLIRLSAELKFEAEKQPE